MFKRILCIMLSICCFAITVADEQVDVLSPYFKLSIANRTSEPMKVYSKRVDLLQHVSPVMTQEVQSRFFKDVHFDCPYALIAFPSLNKMAELHVPIEVKDIYKVNLSNDGQIFMSAQFNEAKSTLLYGFFLFINGELRFEIDQFSTSLIPLKADDDIKIEMIEKCQKYLPKKALRRHYLSQKKYLRRSH